MRPMSWIKKLAFLAIIWAVALVVLLAGTEILLRLTDDGWGSTVRLNIIRNRTYQFDVSKLYDNDPPTISYHRNQYGLRDDCASPAAIDILTVGGSTTDQRYVAQEATFQSVMERDLSRLAGRKICVSNAGVDGHSTYGHELAFRYWFPLIPNLKPKLFVFFIGVNDADFTRQGPSDFDAKRPAGFKGAVKQLRVVQLGYWAAETFRSLTRRQPDYAGHVRENKQLALYTDTQIAADTPERAARNAQGFRIRLRRLLDDAHSGGAEALCVTQPDRMARMVGGRQRGLPKGFGWDGSKFKYGGLDYDYSLRLLNQVMLEECGKDRLVDLYDAPFDDGDFYDYVHATPSGSRKEGTAIARFVAGSDLMRAWRK